MQSCYLCSSIKNSSKCKKTVFIYLSRLAQMLDLLAHSFFRRCLSGDLTMCWFIFFTIRELVKSEARIKSVSFTKALSVIAERLDLFAADLLPICRVLVTNSRAAEKTTDVPPLCPDLPETPVRCTTCRHLEGTYTPIEINYHSIIGSGFFRLFDWAVFFQQ